MNTQITSYPFVLKAIDEAGEEHLGYFKTLEDASLAVSTLEKVYSTRIIRYEILKEGVVVAESQQAKVVTPYYIEYVFTKDAYGISSAYYQLTRLKDEAILFANESLDEIFLHCFHMGINKDQVTIL